jgi:hypothetical protein
MYNSGYKEVSLKYFKEAYKSVGKNYSKDFVHNGIEPVLFFVLDKKVQVGSCVCEGYKLVFVNFMVLHPKPVQVVRLKTPKKHIVNVDRITRIDKQKIYPMPVKEFKGFDNFDYGLDMVGDVDDSIYSDFIRLDFEEFVSFTSKGYPIYDKISKSWVLVEDGYVNLYKFK